MTTEEKLDIAIKALEYYAKGATTREDRDTPFARMEFGCGCCAGVNDDEGICDGNTTIQGLTALEALEKINGIKCRRGDTGCGEMPCQCGTTSEYE